ncbi:MAG: hypothetical protein A2148_00380 [Chloroflexi bacterium RBG_16_68_14]|nr:MAG: hypothetical protein A2148_00380 [Chloroflexi bacterium RBG_16_68_14]
MSATGELALYVSQLQQTLEGLCEAIEGLDEAKLNWRPPALNANSIYVIATHILGNAEAWVLGIACGQPVRRDRPAEFVAAGATAEPIVARASELARRIEEALAGLASAALGELREAPAQLFGAGQPRPVTVREALMHVVEHASTHIGQIQVTRDLALASAEGKSKR